MPSNAELFTVKPESIAPRVDVVGTVASDVKVNLSARIPAYVKEVFVSAGSPVKKGQELITLDDREIQEQVTAAEAQFKQAETEFNRARQLFDNKATTEQALTAAQSMFTAARAQWDRSKVMLTYAQITSPMDGIVTDRRIEPGDLANPGQVLLAIYDPTNMQLEAPVPVRLLAKLPIGQAVEVTLDRPATNFQGRVRQIVSEIDPLSRTQLVKVHIEGTSSDVMPGTFGRLWVADDARTDHHHSGLRRLLRRPDRTGSGRQGPARHPPRGPDGAEARRLRGSAFRSGCRRHRPRRPGPGELTHGHRTETFCRQRDHRGLPQGQPGHPSDHHRAGCRRGGAFLTPREEEPQIVVPLADVMVMYPGGSAQEVERLVSSRLERMLYQIDGVEYVYSMSRPGMAVVTVRFKVGEDREKSLIKLYNKIFQNIDKTTPGIAGWVVKPIEIDDVPIVNVALYSDRYDEYTLYRVGEEVVARLQHITNTGNITLHGGQRRVLHVYLDMERIAAYGLSPMEIAGALKVSNAQMESGGFEQANASFRVEVGPFLRDAAEIRNLMVGAHAGPAGLSARRGRRRGWPRGTPILHPDRFRPRRPRQRPRRRP